MTEPQQVANAGVPDSVAAWEERYAGDDAVWSGNPNEALVATVGSLTPGRVLDVGCGEGADVIWLAENGWDAVGIDLSQTAIDRATEAAAAKGVTASFEVADVSTWSGSGPGSAESEQTDGPRRGGFDLVVGCFLHTRLPDTREELVGKVADHVAPDGRLLLISHAEMPPWAQNYDEELGHGEGHHHEPVSPNGDFALLIGGSPVRWEIDLAELRTREVEGPDGQPAELDDSVLLAHRITD
ncbi:MULTISPECIES: SAM-dependent methyltransferase [Brevibacterium]|uniref:Methyltransferase domain-containing protein n=2 Tax=Brevibacterium TaxID=1696 RepID=A0A1H1S6F6_BRESA|nr:class I SAM-dependent methyltransferase [Brevibacterium sandarakinum]SDS43521.1 Methyltransferase domain-containing protein [Brevibacterium sandarakinum]